MSEFYSSIAGDYDKIFPFVPPQLAFVKSFLSSSSFNLLDIGCGTGNLSLELAKFYQSIEAIDLDEDMLQLAKTKQIQSDNLHFQVADMLRLNERFSAGQFDGILCFGNTLVHLDLLKEMETFLVQAYDLLKTDGQLLIQVINYDRVIDQQVDGLATIERMGIQFVRKYKYQADKHKIDFETILSSEEREEPIINHVDLYPLRKQELENLLSKTGFSSLQFFGNFKKGSFSESSIPMIVAATKS